MKSEIEISLSESSLISIILLFVGLFGITNAQIPTGYYDGTDGLCGAALKTKLSQIITNGLLMGNPDFIIKRCFTWNKMEFRFFILLVIALK